MAWQRNRRCGEENMNIGNQHIDDFISEPGPSSFSMRARMTSVSLSIVKYQFMLTPPLVRAARGPG
jgi:hypothetical protein